MNAREPHKRRTLRPQRWSYSEVEADHLACGIFVVENNVDSITITAFFVVFGQNKS